MKGLFNELTEGVGKTIEGLLQLLMVGMEFVAVAGLVLALGFFITFGAKLALAFLGISSMDVDVALQETFGLSSPWIEFLCGCGGVGAFFGYQWARTRGRKTTRLRAN